MAKRATVMLDDTTSDILCMSSSTLDGESVKIFLQSVGLDPHQREWTVKAADLMEAIKACTYRNEED